MKRELKRERTTRLLLDATKELIREKGCAQTTLSDIMERTGLSKGAIFHYVKSKDELFSWVLKERLEDTNRRFLEATAKQAKSFSGPMQEIIDRLPELEEPNDVANQVFTYLLGQSDQPEVREVIRRFYEQALEVSKQCIVAGQLAGVIPPSVDAAKTADLFVVISLGLRVRSAVSSDRFAFDSSAFAALMADMLQPKQQ
ncbi:TetR/AcrR family transcriptional regulator [Alicyclobacillus macrosporangiidus]|uniref:TetR/AcrR family transcriptional regulator n=1 Tax=Alicyclobacillus macrosporangiidus TaxID=392015 RepID=UPI000497CD0D|nr:TetR/AcrR family transcriptional regulator [Alicyclobacillus macrosporangiidus]